MARACAAVIAAVLAMPPALAGQEPGIGEVLARAAAYVADYQTRLAGIVAEEHYRQNVVTPTRRSQNRQFRELRSDILLVKAGDEDRWLQFRDVFEVDRKPIRDRDERLYKLFVNARTDPRAQAETIQEESARYNIGPLHRTINIPIMGLLFFEGANQERVTFKQARAGSMKPFRGLADEAAIRVIEYRETEPGTLVRGARDLDIPSHGRAWIDGATGRVLRTEQISEDTAVRAVIDVSYKREEGLDLLVPAEMRETYIIRRSEVRIDGRASYSRFRRFTVTTTEKPKG